jgi:hypothetical protein
MKINGIEDQISYKEAIGFSVVFEAYAEDCSGEIIMEIGFNANSGYVYIALENGISICSMLGSSAEYIVTDFNDGEEYFLDSYEDATDKLDELAD